MIVLSFLLVLVALGLLVIGLIGASQALVWGSIAASLMAGLCLVVAVIQQRRIHVVGGDHGASPGHDFQADEPTTIITPAAGEPARGPSRVEAPAEAGQRPDSPSHGEPTGAQVTGTPGGQAAQYPPEQGGYYDDLSDEPPEEEISPSDVLRTADLRYEVLVVDGRPRYHLRDCPHLHGRETVPLPLAEAREAGFTPCARCRPDGTLAARSRGSFNT